MAFYNNSSLIGVNFNTTTTTQLFTLGTTTEGSDGTLWQYTKANTSVSAYAVVAITPSGACAMCSIGDAVLGYQLAVPQIAFAASEYGWVPVHGVGGANSNLKVLAATMTATSIYISATTGRLSYTESGSATIHGITIYGASGSDVGGVTSLACILTWPKCNIVGA